MYIYICIYIYLYIYQNKNYQKKSLTSQILLIIFSKIQIFFNSINNSSKKQQFFISL